MSIIVLVSFELNSPDLLKDWKKKSAEISKNLSEVDGFIFRESAVDEKGKVYCIVKWESEEHQAAFRKIMESEVFQDKMSEFGKLVNMSTMSRQSLQVFS